MKLFVYGTLKEGYGNHSLIKNRYITKDNYIVNGYRVKNYNGLPYAIQDANSSIKGELFTFLNSDILEEVDRLEGYKGPDRVTNLYDRIQLDSNPIIYMYIAGKLIREEIKKYAEILKTTIDTTKKAN